jgi:hypothetical protein
MNTSPCEWPAGHDRAEAKSGRVVETFPAETSASGRREPEFTRHASETPRLIHDVKARRPLVVGI